MPEYIMTFGEYKGDDISEVPRRRLEWYLEHIEDGGFPWMERWDRDELLEAIEVELIQRDRSYSDY